MHFFRLKCQPYDKESVCRLHCCIVPRRIGQVIIFFKKFSGWSPVTRVFHSDFIALSINSKRSLSSQPHREQGASCFELKFLAQSFLASMKGYDSKGFNSKVLANYVQNPTWLEWRFEMRTSSKMPSLFGRGLRSSGKRRGGAEWRSLRRVARVTSARRRGRLRLKPGHSHLGRLGQI